MTRQRDDLRQRAREMIDAGYSDSAIIGELGIERHAVRTLRAKVTLQPEPAEPHNCPTCGDRINLTICVACSAEAWRRQQK